MRVRDWVFASLALIAAAVCGRLGMWQLDRLAERRARNAEIAARRALPALDLTAGGAVATARAESLSGRRVTATGEYDYARERLWPARTYQGMPGVALVTPLRLADGSGVLVDRGWVPAPDAARIDRTRYREGDRATVDGLALAAPRGRGDVDPAVLGDSVPYVLLPVVVQQLPDARGSRGVGPSRWPAPALDDGPHVVYAIQWFSFAVIVLVGTVALLRRGAKDGAASRGR